MKRIDVAIAIVFRSGQVLICRRHNEARLGGYWEFPGGKVEAGEAVVEALARELREEVEIAVEPIIRLPVVEHDYPDVHVRLHPFLCAHTRGEPKAIGCQELKWIDPQALREHQFPPANKDLIEQVIWHLDHTPADAPDRSFAREP